MTDTINQLKSVQAHIVKELTGGLMNDQLRQGEDMMGIASAEIIDTEGDIIRVDGIDVSKYHNPPKRHIKILAGHEHKLASGEPSIIGRVERFWTTTIEVDGKEVKALAFALSFAKDAETGELTPLANAYKKLMPKYIDSFSVGMSVGDYGVLEETGGLDVKASTLYEISAVSVPANAEANVIKSIKQAFKDIEQEAPIEKEEVEEPAEEETKKEVTSEEGYQNTDISEGVQKLITTEFGRIEKRLDSIEAILAVLSKAKNEQTDSPKSRSSAEELESLKAISMSLQKLKGLKTER